MNSTNSTSQMLIKYYFAVLALLLVAPQIAIASNCSLADMEALGKAFRRPIKTPQQQAAIAWGLMANHGGSLVVPVDGVARRIEVIREVERSRFVCTNDK